MLKRAARRLLDRAGLELRRKDAPGRFIDPFAELKHLGRPVRTIFDVGANVGDVTRRLAREHPQAIVHAFEPVPGTFATLEHQIAALPNVRAHCCALGADATRRAMHVFDDSCLNTLVDRAPFVAAFEPPSRGEVAIDMTTIDAFCERHHIDAIDVLKIDTEGFELDVLSGGRRMLSNRAVTFIVCEFTEIRRSQGAGAPGFIEIHDFLAAFGFRLFMIQNDYVVPEKNYFAVRNALFVLP